MKIELESTDTVVSLNGVECRLWHGRTDGGVTCFVYVHRIVVPNVGDNCAQFNRELLAKGQSAGPPPGVPAGIDLRKMV